MNSGEVRRAAGPGLLQPFPPSQLPDGRWQVPAFEWLELAPRRTRYAVGIPVIDEDGRLHRQLARMRSAGIFELADVVLADGGSRDGSTEPARLLEAGLSALLVKTGPGRLSAQLRMLLAFGLWRGYEGFVLVDGNDKDGVEAIPEFLRALEQGWDYVQGSRYRPGGFEENTPLSRKVAVRWLHAPLLSLSSGFHYTDTTNGFRALGRRFLLDPGLQPFRDVFQTYDLHYYLSRQAPRLGYRVRELPVSRVYPAAGPAPSKIAGLAGYLRIFGLLLKTAAGRYDPSGETAR